MFQDLVLIMDHITKTFPGVIALENVNLELRKGEVLCLLGENGAGKSTLLKILAGAYKRDTGEIKISGRLVDFKNPREAIAHGIAVIYQELNYISDLTVAENIFLERQPTKGLLHAIDWQKMNDDARKVLEQIGVKIDPKQEMNRLSVAEKQLVEIAKAISRDMKILVTDEPTSALNDTEVRKLFEVMKRLKGVGVSIIFISHRLEEVLEISDRVLVLRDGKNAGLVETGNTDKDELIALMVGRKLGDLYPKKKNKIGSVLFEVRDLCGHRLVNLNLRLHKGEVLGVFGLLGSGIHQLGDLLFGKEPSHQGQVFVQGALQKINSPMAAIQAKIAFVPAERKIEGLVLSMNVTENISLTGLLIKGSPVLNHKADQGKARHWVENLRIKTPSVETKVEHLSGGNQQKVVLSKWLDLKPDIIILAEPTRGIDVGAKAEIYQLMEQFCENGAGVILISSELPEIIALSDRILVMHEGQIQGEVNREAATQERIMQLAIGGN